MYSIQVNKENNILKIKLNLTNRIMHLQALKEGLQYQEILLLKLKRGIAIKGISNLSILPKRVERMK